MVDGLCPQGAALMCWGDIQPALYMSQVEGVSSGMVVTVVRCRPGKGVAEGIRVNAGGGEKPFSEKSGLPLNLTLYIGFNPTLCYATPSHSSTLSCCCHAAASTLTAMASAPTSTANPPASSSQRCGGTQVDGICMQGQWYACRDVCGGAGGSEGSVQEIRVEEPASTLQGAGGSEGSVQEIRVKLLRPQELHTLILIPVSSSPVPPPPCPLPLFPV